MRFGLSGRVALVTGAHRGTGAVIAQMLAAEGATVAVHGHAPGDAQEVVRAIRAAGGSAAEVHGDLTEDAGAAAVVEAAAEQAGPPLILINNWGGVAPGRWLEGDLAPWYEDYERNVLSAVRLARLCAPPMQAAGWGRIVNLGTLGTLQPPSRTPHYYAAKAALAAASASLARALGPHGITVNTVSPGLIRTQEVESHIRTLAARNNWGDDWAEIERQALAHFGSASPSGRMSTREDVASAVVFLASEPAGHISGVNLRVDGGAGAMPL